MMTVFSGLRLIASLWLIMVCLIRFLSDQMGSLHRFGTCLDQKVRRPYFHYFLNGRLREYSSLMQFLMRHCSLGLFID